VTMVTMVAMVTPWLLRLADEPKKGHKSFAAASPLK